MLLLVVVIAFGVGAIFAERAFAGKVDLFLFGLGLLTATLLLIAMPLGYWLYCHRTLRYTADRNAITIIWGGVRHVIPVQNTVVIAASDIAEPLRETRWRGVRWPGYSIGLATLSNFPLPNFTPAPEGDLSLPALEASKSASLAALPASASAATTTVVEAAEPEPAPPSATLSPITATVYATQPLANCLFVCTPAQVYAISPHDGQQFAAEVRVRQALGSTDVPLEATYQRGLRSNPFWRDRAAQVAILIGIVINLGLFAYLCASFTQMTDIRSLPMHWNSNGQVDYIGQRAEIFRLPLFGLISLGVAVGAGLWVGRNDRGAARFLYAGVAAVQIIFWAAVINILA